MKCLICTLFVAALATVHGKPLEESNERYERILNDLEEKIKNDDTGIWEEIQRNFQETVTLINNTVNEFTNEASVCSENFQTSYENMRNSVESSIESFAEEVKDRIQRQETKFKQMENELHDVASLEPNYKDLEKLFNIMKKSTFNSFKAAENKFHMLEATFDELNGKIQMLQNILQDSFINLTETVAGMISTADGEFNKEYDTFLRNFENTMNEIEIHLEEIKKQDNRDELLNAFKSNMRKNMQSVSHKTARSIKLLLQSLKLTCKVLDSTLERISTPINQLIESLNYNSLNLDSAFSMDFVMISTELEQMKRMAGLVVKKVTENGEVTLGYDDHIPIIGFREGDMTFTVDMNNDVTTIIASGVDSEGKYVREVTEEKIDDRTSHVTEKFKRGSDNATVENYVFIYE